MLDCSLTLAPVQHRGAELEQRRERLIARARGRVLEISTGARVDRTRYRNVDDVVQTTPRAAMVDGHEHHSFDTIVLLHVLCSVSDVFSTLQRVDELLADGGQVLALEHVRATGARGRVQDAATPLWRRVRGGCRANRDAIAALRRGGFAVTDCDRFMMRATRIDAPAVSAVAMRKVR